MVRFIHCIKKREDISQAEFRDYWNSEGFDELIGRTVSVTGAVRNSKSLTLQVEANLILRNARGTAEPFDGIIEYFWDNAAALMDIYATEEVQAILQEMTEYQARFVDAARSTGFFTEA